MVEWRRDKKLMITVVGEVVTDFITKKKEKNVGS